MKAKSNLLVILMMIFAISTSMAQKGVEDGSKYGHGEDSIRALQNLSMYKQFYKQKSYKDAIKSWRVVFNEAPLISKNMYIHGVNMYKIKYKNAKTWDLREKYVDTIMLIYDQRMKYFDEDELLARKGVDLNNLSKNRKKEAYDMLHKAVEKMGNKTPEFAINELMQAALSLYKDEKISADEMVNDFALSSDIVDHQIKNATGNEKETLNKIQQNVELIFINSGAATCETLVPLLTDKFEKAPKDIDNLKKTVGLLRKFDCEDSDVYEKAAVNLYDLEPSANSAYGISRVFLKKENWEKAVFYYEEATKLEEDSLTKARYHKELAEVLLAANMSPVKAVQNAREALKYNPKDGSPYITIGRAYANANIGENKFEKSTKYWAAVDMFYKAKAVDQSQTDVANKLIGTYSQYFPNKEEAFFYNITEGSTYTVPGWIGHTTKVRF
jgi:tetratricopeptide (TPR) repeat protein